MDNEDASQQTRFAKKKAQPNIITQDEQQINKLSQSEKLKKVQKSPLVTKTARNNRLSDLKEESDEESKSIESI